MKPTTRTALATLFSAAGAALSALASEFSGAEAAAATPATPETPAEPTPKKKAAKAAAAAAPEEPKEEKTEEPAAEETESRYDIRRAAIEPLVKDGKGAEVKKIIAKYDPDSTPPSIKTMPEKNHAAFLKDLATLEY